MFGENRFRSRSCWFAGDGALSVVDVGELGGWVEHISVVDEAGTRSFLRLGSTSLEGVTIGVVPFLFLPFVS